jgi:hypothetical protein
MTSRSSSSVITFLHPFAVGAHAAELPAGDYRLTIEEEMIEGPSFAAFHRTATILETPAIGVASAARQFLYVTTDDLDAAQQEDDRRAGSGTA